MHRNIHHIILSLSLVLILCIGPFRAGAQDLTGTWEGKTNHGEYVLMVLTGEGNTWVGYTYDSSSGKSHCKADFKGNFKADDRLLSGEGKRFIEKSAGHSLCSYGLIYRSQKDGDYLIGGLTANSNKLMYTSIPVNVRLRRISKTVDTTAYMADWWNSRQAKAGKE